MHILLRVYCSYLYLGLLSFIVESFFSPLTHYFTLLVLVHHWKSAAINPPSNNLARISVTYIPVGPVLEPLLGRKRWNLTTKLGTQCGAHGWWMLWEANLCLCYLYSNCTSSQWSDVWLQMSTAKPHAFTEISPITGLLFVNWPTTWPCSSRLPVIGF